MAKDRTDWVGPAGLAVLAVIVARLVALGFNRTDLFVDESQYWLWGQRLDFGYYSKPPLIAWVIRTVTALAGSDAPFWVRMPGAVLHGATAMMLAALAARLFGARAGFWVAISYVTTPFATVGSLLMSTDTVMAPAYATALYGWFRLAETRAARFAVLAGAAAGLAFMAKYAAVYVLLGGGLAALVLPAMRIGWRNGAVLTLAFAVVIAPNVIWNLTHDLTTVSHTMDNVGWVRQTQPLSRFHPDEFAGFLSSQFAVFGPILFAGFLMASTVVWRSGHQDAGRALVLFALPILLIVCVQAFLAKAYANWAVATYFAGTVLVVPYLLARAPRLLWLSVALNTAFAVFLPLMTILAPEPQRNGQPLLHRYLGRAALSQQIIAAAQQVGATAVVAEDRDVLADLFYTGRDAGLTFYTRKPEGRAHNYYEQNFALPDDAGPTLYVLTMAPQCGRQPLAAVVRFDTAQGAYAATEFAGYVLPAGCVHAPG